MYNLISAIKICPNQYLDQHMMSIPPFLLPNTSTSCPNGRAYLVIYFFYFKRSEPLGQKTFSTWGVSFGSLTLFVTVSYLGLNDMPMQDKIKNATKTVQTFVASAQPKNVKPNPVNHIRALTDNFLLTLYICSCLENILSDNYIRGRVVEEYEGTSTYRRTF